MGVWHALELIHHDSYFGKQEGDFSVVLRSISARKTTDRDEERKAKEAVGTLRGPVPERIGTVIRRERGTGWFEWFSGLCTVS